jgi:hypothetical protein
MLCNVSVSGRPQGKLNLSAGDGLAIELEIETSALPVVGGRDLF